MYRNDSAVSVDSLISSSTGYTNWESDKFGLLSETTLSIHLYVRLNNAAFFFIFLLFLRALKNSDSNEKQKKSRPGEIQSCFQYERNNLLAFLPPNSTNLYQEETSANLSIFLRGGKFYFCAPF